MRFEKQRSNHTYVTTINRKKIKLTRYKQDYLLTRLSTLKK